MKNLISLFGACCMLLFMSFAIFDNYDQINYSKSQFETFTCFSEPENFPCWEDWDDPEGEPVTFHQCKEPKDSDWCTVLTDKFPKGEVTSCSDGGL